MTLLPRLAFLSCLALPLWSPQAVAATPRAAVVTDTARDAKHPAVNQQLLIPSAGVGMNALLMQAAGQGIRRKR